MLSARCKLPPFYKGTSAHKLHSVRAPTADLPNVAAFLGGMVAQEAIKMITRQYIPVNGYCVIDLVDTWTGVLPS
jgi:NEDD8-activating enzyme E1 regulatory subunit